MWYKYNNMYDAMNDSHSIKWNGNTSHYIKRFINWNITSNRWVSLIYFYTCPITASKRTAISVDNPLVTLLLISVVFHVENAPWNILPEPKHA